MDKIIESYLAHTKYGMNTVVKTESGNWYQHMNIAMCPEGGGVSIWQKLDVDENGQPLIENQDNNDQH